MTIAELVAEIEKLSLLDAAELVKALEEKFGVSAAAPVAVAAAPAAAGAQVKSPLPGSVVKVCVNEGQDVKKGDTLLILESMKMENPILAEQDGKVAQVAVAAGQTVMQDDLLVVLA